MDSPTIRKVSRFTNRREGTNIENFITKAQLQNTTMTWTGYFILRSSKTWIFRLGYRPLVIPVPPKTTRRSDIPWTPMWSKRWQVNSSRPQSVFGYPVFSLSTFSHRLRGSAWLFSLFADSFKCASFRSCVSAWEPAFGRSTAQFIFWLP